MPNTHSGPFVDQAVAFLDSIGIPCQAEPGAVGFLPGIDIRDGVLHYDPQVPVSNLLHEAGHLAILPGEYRRRAGSNISGIVKAMFQELAAVAARDVDGPLTRAMMQTSDPEATAWAWAVGEHLGIPLEQIILPHEYDGEGESIARCLRMRGYVGINGLAHAGFCVVRPGLEKVYGRPAFPRLAMWVQREVADLIPAGGSHPSSRPDAAAAARPDRRSPKPRC